MNTNKNSVRFTIDFFNKKIIGTKASFAKAGKGVGDAYAELSAKIASHPDFQLVQKDQEKRCDHAKRTYKGMNYKFMERYIRIQKNAEQLEKEYKAVRDMAESAGRNEYPFTKKWFLNTFGDDENGFDMEEATRAITEAMIGKAVSSVAPAEDQASHASVSTIDPVENQRSAA